MTFDVATIKDAAAGRWPEILESLAGIDIALLDDRHHACPKCRDGVDRFRMIDADADAGATFCNVCGQHIGDGIATLQWMTGDSFPQTTNRVAEFLGLANAARAAGNGKLDVVADVARRKRIPLDEFKVFGAHQAQRGKLTVFRVPRYNEKGEHCSDFDLATIDDKFLKGLCTKGKPSRLFLREGKLPEPGETVHLVEGVKDAAALASTGRVVVGLPAKEWPSSSPGCFAIAMSS